MMDRLRLRNAQGARQFVSGRVEVARPRVFRGVSAPTADEALVRQLAASFAEEDPSGGFGGGSSFLASPRPPRRRRRRPRRPPPRSPTRSWRDGSTKS